MGKSSGSSTTQVQLTPEQRETLSIQNEALKSTFLPAYKSTVGGAEGVMGQVMPAATQAANTALGVSGRTGALQEAAGAGGLVSGMAGLQSLFDPQYEQQQVNAALQAGRESARESQAGQNAMYGGAGSMGSARMGIADSNLASLNAQRQATAAAEAQARVQANRANAAGQIMSQGQQLANLGLGAASQQVGYSTAPMDLYGKYASIVYGTPQASTTPNFSGTQGSTTQGKGMGFKL